MPVVSKTFPAGFVQKGSVLFGAVGRGWIHIWVSAPAAIDIYLDGAHFSVITPQNAVVLPSGDLAFQGENTYHFYQFVVIATRQGFIPQIKIGAYYEG
ncbi:MAG: hypothetical protein ACP5I3_09020 [Thermoproteus sp.]